MSLINIINASFQSGGEIPSDIQIVLPIDGQSNCVGQPPGITGLPSGWLSEQNNIKIWWEGDYYDHNILTGSFVKMKPPDNTRYWEYTEVGGTFYDITGWGIEQKCAHNIVDNYNTTLYVLKSGKGGAAIDNWKSAVNGVMWVQTKRFFENATAEVLASGKTPYFLPMAWLQGESDALVPAKYAIYEAALRTVISDLRGINVYTADMPFVMFKLASNHYGAVGTATINAAFDAIAADTANCFVIETSQFEANVLSQPYPGHYKYEALLELGNIYYDFIVDNGFLTF